MSGWLGADGVGDAAFPWVQKACCLRGLALPGRSAEVVSINQYSVTLRVELQAKAIGCGNSMFVVFRELDIFIIAAFARQLIIGANGWRAAY